MGEIARRAEKHQGIGSDGLVVGDFLGFSAQDRFDQV
jgi:hypothetical protein